MTSRHGLNEKELDYMSIKGRGIYIAYLGTTVILCHQLSQLSNTPCYGKSQTHILSFGFYQQWFCKHRKQVPCGILAQLIQTILPQ